MDYWSSYNKKCLQRIEYPHNAGTLSEQWGMHCITTTLNEGDIVLKLSFLVDETDGVIADAKFQLCGPTFLIAAADILCELVLRKNYVAACQINLELIEKQLGEFAEELKTPLKLLFRALDQIKKGCEEKKLPQDVITPIPKETENHEYPDWQNLTHEQKLALIEKVIADDVRPYIELDEGGIEVQELLNDKELIIAYSGACTSCFSSVGSTLSTIQAILQSKVHKELIVVPNSP